MRTLARSIWSKLVRPNRADDAPRPDAGTLIGIAGTANAMVRTTRVKTRRGTFLVLVVGTLALLSVIAIVYVTIGTQDTRVQAAAVKREKVEDIPQRVGDYLADVIGRDRIATYYDDSSIRPAGAPQNGLPVLMREINDYPSTDMAVRSDDAQPHASWRFDPAGTIDTRFWTGPASQVRGSMPPSDPWLATGEPTWIGIDPADPQQLADPTDVTRLYRDMKDWGHISNFAPNGRFVNLNNLRGNLYAATGTAPGQMSSGLTLYDANGNPSINTFFNEAADPEIPALWDTNQRGAARPAAFVPYAPASAAEDPSSSSFKLYQWADADGDGVLDSRWFELIDDRNGFINYLGDMGRYRYFIAARAVDLSARVNVNVATDFRSAARIDAPAGVTPGDVDLLRLLALTDSYDFNAPTTGNESLGGGYDNFRNPGDQALSSDYGPAGAPSHANQLVYPPANLAPGYARNRALAVAEFGYASLRLSVASGIPFGPTTLDSAVSLQGVGLLDNTVATDLNIAAPLWNTDDAQLGAARRRQMYQRFVSGGVGVYDNAAAPGGWRSNVRFAMPDLAELLTRNTVNDPDTLSTLELVLGGRDDTTNTPGQGSARYSPLRDNRDLKLELASVPDAAYDVPNAFDSNGADSVNSPLEAFEARYLMQMQSDVRQRLTTVSGSVPLRPVRGVQTGALSVVELPTDIGAILDPEYDLLDSISQVTQGTPINQVLPTVKLDGTETRSIFRAYADQLLPYSGTTVNGVNAWDLGSRVAGEMQTASYGYRGPEVALYAAAHLTANFVDMADTERVTKSNNDPGNPPTFDDDYDANIPSVHTLVVRYDPSDPLGTGRTPSASIPNDVYIGDRFAAGGIGDNRELNLNLSSPSTESVTGRLPQLGAATAKTVTPANQLGVNIFGIEAQPFLTRVSVFTTYIDQDTARGAQVIIDGSINSTNRDFAYRVVAWQLTNPFDVPVVLWDNAAEAPAGAPPALGQTERPKSRYYVEMDGRTYLIRPLNDSGITYNVGDATAPTSDRNIIIYPHRSIVLYALSDTPTAIATRIDPAFTAAEVRRAVQNTLGEVTTNDPGDTGFNANPADYHPDRTRFQAMYYIGAVTGADPRAQETPAAASFSSLITTDRPESRLWRRVRTLSQSIAGAGAAASTVEFDQLIDRLRVPDGDGATASDPDVYPVLNRRLGDPATDTAIGANTPISDSAVGPLPGDPDPGFNKAVITLWATVRRPANPGEPLTGALPAYCLEPKGTSRWNVFNNDRIDIGTGTWDPINATMPRTGWSLDAEMFRDNASSPTGTDGNSAYRKFSDWRSSVLNQRFVYRPDSSASAAPANEDDSPVMLNIVPNLWGTTGANPELRTLVGNSSRPTPGNSVSNANRYNPLVPQTRYYNQWYPQVALNNSYFMAPNTPSAGNPLTYTRSIRVADMLMPLAVGPMMNPGFPANDTNLSGPGSTQLLSGRPWTNMELRWTTLGEAMAVALGYQPSTGNDGTDSLSVRDIATLSSTFAIDGAAAIRDTYVKRPLFDRGQLRLDEFVLFRDLNDNGLFDYASSGGGGGGNTDIRLFTEMPAALGILDAFTVSPLGISRVQNGFAGFISGFPKERDAAELTRPIQGLININTASPTVLRTIPGLAPWADAAQRNEIQRIVFNPQNTVPSGTAPASGTLRLALGSAQATSIIDVSAAVAGGLQAHIESINGVGPGNVKVSMVTMNPPTFDVEFIGALAATDVADLSVVARTGQGQITPTTFQAAVPPTIGPRWANGSVLNYEVDLAAVVAATRDKSRQFLRPQSSVSDFTVTQQGLAPAAVRTDLDPNASTGFTVEQLSFFDREPGATGALAARDLFWPTGFNNPAQIDTWLAGREGRRAITEIRGISEREGFTTVGSVQAAASVRDGNPNTDRFTGLDPAGQVSDFAALPISIDSMGYKTAPTTAGVLDTQNHDMLYGQFLRARQDTSQLGLSTSFFQTTWVNNGDRNNRNRVTPDAIPGDYMEKLTPLAAMSNIATTRSDYFAVWFVIHGYNEEDVSGLAPTDPLTPSIARRFLMILDRSNVTAEGQRPKVVLFRELPYTP